MRIDNEHDVIDLALCELHRARKLYPEWPQRLVEAAAIASEEAGEVLKAANDIQWHGKSSIEHLRTEAIQAIAMFMRLLLDTSALRENVDPMDTSGGERFWEKAMRLENNKLRPLILDQDSEIQRLRAEVQRLTVRLEDELLDPVENLSMVTSTGKTHTADYFMRKATGTVQP